MILELEFRNAQLEAANRRLAEQLDFARSVPRQRV